MSETRIDSYNLKKMFPTLELTSNIFQKPELTPKFFQKYFRQEIFPGPELTSKIFEKYFRLELTPTSFFKTRIEF